MDGLSGPARTPDRRFLTVSPGNTTGTQAASGLQLPMSVADE